ncbi:MULTISPECIES: ATP-grasp ribosomal peptide maturase [unclassified Streptomyces]|uniref:ATP-grasp ribosomal peptide maturase n=1 Tax=Streptomyces TaxID=1883 RepID=UPI0024A9373D|nr:MULTISPECIES: ATP-grasp ribosomal peptide maturase [unclassified Streptomyces]
MDGRRGSVLVLTNLHDVTTDIVLRVLAARRVPVVRLDPGTDLLAGSSLSASYGTGGQRGVLRTPSRDLDLTRVQSVWVRRPSAYDGPPGLDEHDRRFAREQAFWGIGGVLASLPHAHYVNHPWNNRAAEHKPTQLAAAQRVGFLVPDTLITQVAREAREFVARHCDGVVYKPVWNSPYRVAGRPHSVWVREVREEEVTDAVAVCPHLFQARVDKAFDVRVTAVGSWLSGVRIDSPDLDWRRRQGLMRCGPVEVPGAVEQSVHAYLAHFRLVYGAFDFAVTHDGTWYFLECNPNGQWAWQPPDVTDGIAHALADQLEKGSAP